MQAIYEKSTSFEDWQYRLFLADVRLADCSKGENLSAGELVYVRYWQRRWLGAGEPPDAITGHRELPPEGEFANETLLVGLLDGRAISVIRYIR